MIVKFTVFSTYTVSQLMLYDDSVFFIFVLNPMKTTCDVTPGLKGNINVKLN